MTESKSPINRHYKTASWLNSMLTMRLGGNIHNRSYENVIDKKQTGLESFV